VLGTQAVSAIPELSRILFQTNSASGACVALARIGPDAWPVLRAALTNSDPKICQAATIAAYYSLKFGRTIVPDLTALLTNTNPILATSAGRRLSNLLPAEEFVGTITNVSGPNRSLAERVLLSTMDLSKSNFTFAVPVVVPMLESPDPSVRRQATNILIKLAPDVAVANGISTNVVPGYRGPRPGGRGFRPAPRTNESIVRTNGR